MGLGAGYTLLIALAPAPRADRRGGPGDRGRALARRGERAAPPARDLGDEGRRLEHPRPRPVPAAHAAPAARPARRRRCPRRSSTASSPSSASPTRSGGDSTLEVTGAGRDVRDEPPGEGQAVAEHAGQRDRRRDLRPVRASSRASTRRRRCSIEPEGTTIQRGTDIRFLRRLARRNGFDCYVQPEPLSGLDRATSSRGSSPGCRRRCCTSSMGAETNVCGLQRPLRDDAADRRRRRRARRRDEGAAAGASLRRRCEQPLGARADAAAAMLPPPIVRPADTGLPRTAELQRGRAGDRRPLDLGGDRRGRRSGSTSGVLRPGGLVTIRGAGRLYNGSYFVTRVRHTIATGGYAQRFEAGATP